MPIDRTSHLTAHHSDPNTRNRSFYRSFIQFLCSNIGLVIIVVGYSIGGAFLFILLEQYIQLQNCQQANLQENVSVANISESMYNYVTIGSENTTIMYEQMVSYLENFTNDIYDRRSTFSYTGQDCSTASGWTFPSALLFTITVITSIGYGYVTPTSWEGQITCICYALIGIPIFLLCLANISSILGDMFRFLYSTLLHCVCCCCRIYTRNKRRQMRRRKSFNQQENHYVGATSIDPTWPEAHRHVHRGRLSDDEDNIDQDNEDEIDDVWDRMESRVPILVVISIIIGYIFLGAVMFSASEGWTMIESVYFCYITLSTIGFGDYVPGITSSSTNGLRFLSASLYIIIGLAILAMCFDLINQSIVDNFAWIAEKLGFKSEDDDQIDEDRTRYANFQFSEQQEINHAGRLDVKSQLSESPPTYDYACAEEQWSNDIKDKVESRTNIREKREINTKFGKH